VPEDREPAVRKLIEEAGGKVISYYMTTGDRDFLLISEANGSEAIIAALMAFSAAGMISDVATVRAWTAAEFKSIAERGAKAAKAYRPPGKHWSHHVQDLRNNSGSFDGALVVLIVGLVWTGVRSWTNRNDDRPD
jgi:uncharacterized protein with GYD domain